MFHNNKIAVREAVGSIPVGDTSLKKPKRTPFFKKEFFFCEYSTDYWSPPKSMGRSVGKIVAPIISTADIVATTFTTMFFVFSVIPIKNVTLYVS